MLQASAESIVQSGSRCCGIQAVAHNSHVIVLRDQGTIEALAHTLPGKRRVVLVGNGGIALEVAHALSGVEVSLANSALNADRTKPVESTLCMESGTSNGLVCICSLHGVHSYFHAGYM